MKNKRLLKPFLLTLMISAIQAPITANAQSTKDRIHFLSTGQSDCILLESNGRFALIDSGEDTGTSRTRLPQVEIDQIKNLPGYEKEIIDYLHSLGVKELEFSIATHAHSDHVSNFDVIFDEFPTKTLYTREYIDSFINADNEKINIFSNKDEYKWDNQEVYDDMIESANRNNVNIVYIDDYSPMENLNFMFGDFTVDIVNNNSYNTEEARARKTLSSENANSFGVVVSKNDKRAFLGGDIGNYDGDEDYLISNARTKDLIKNVDLYKFAHHGMNGTVKFLNHINPKLTIITGADPKDNWIGYSSIQSAGIENIYTTVSNSNIVVDIPDSGAITSTATNKYIVPNGWRRDSGKWYYNINSVPVKGLQLLGASGVNNWYYFDNNGVMQTGWQMINKNGQNNWYYFSETGQMVTGWKQIYNNGQYTWYYFDNYGRMQTGWQLLYSGGQNSWFYFDNSGAMITGWKQLYYNGEYIWYYFNNSGHMLTGWQLVTYNGKSDWYYFDGSGKMLTGWQLLNYGGKSEWYYFDNSGMMATGWRQINYNGQWDWYYFNTNGTMKTGYLYIGGKTYYLRVQAEGNHPKGSMV